MLVTSIFSLPAMFSVLSKTIICRYLSRRFLYHCKKNVFEGIPESACLSIRLFIRVSVCVQNSSFCQRGGMDIKSHLVTALILYANFFNVDKSKIMSFCTEFILYKKIKCSNCLYRRHMEVRCLHGILFE